ncbi:MAG TPA: hypothetical protein PKA27_07605 [Fimbriimonadaceae bacterium]|nr:hypothetical protein [Fimbriimonadaceae bacterium]
MKSQVLSALQRAVAFAESQGLDTWDPYDFRGTPLFLRAPKAAVKVLYGLAFLAPVATRRLLGVKPVRSAGGVAGLAHAYCDLGEQTKAEPLIQWLLENPSRTQAGLGWGLPFAWKSGFGIVPANTPIGHTTITVGNALLAYGSDENASNAAAWIRSELKFNAAFGGLAASYTPNDTTQCVNSNADVASFLAKVAVKNGSEDLLDLSRQILTFVVNSQNEDGSWNYLAGVRSGSGSQIDHYHTGMILCALQHLAYQFFDDRAVEAYTRGLRFYMDHLFRPDNGPKFTAFDQDPVDIYGCAEGIITLVNASNDPHLNVGLREEAKQRAQGLVHFTLSRMQDSRGAFAYRKYPAKTMWLDSLRWAQAPMIRALARYASSLE